MDSLNDRASEGGSFVAWGEQGESGDEYETVAPLISLEEVHELAKKISVHFISADSDKVGGMCLCYFFCLNMTRIGKYLQGLKFTNCVWNSECFSYFHSSLK